MFEKNLKQGYLLDFYGDVLSERKREVLSMYYNEDFSLAEIAESEQAASEMMQAFERKIKSTNTVALIAVGVCVLAAAVALIVRFAM